MAAGIVGCDNSILVVKGYGGRGGGVGRDLLRLPVCMSGDLSARPMCVFVCARLQHKAECASSAEGVDVPGACTLCVEP